jgi:hypothetical protein
MNEQLHRIGQAAVAALLATAFVLIGSAVLAAEASKTPSLWFDATQLPSFTGVVDRFLANPSGRSDRLVFREGPQIVFPPDAFEAIRDVAPVGRSLVVWGIRARNGPAITMLAFAAPDSQPTVLDRFYWRTEQGPPAQDRREMLLIGTVWVPYLSPQGQTAGAILENGDVVRVEPKVAALFKDRFVAGAKIVAGGTGIETALGRAIDADQIGASMETLQSLPHPQPATVGGEARPAR